MTVATTDGAGLPANPEDLDNVGLEDIDVNDLVIPRLRINHDDGTFVTNLGGDEFSTLDCVVLGLVKQRIMWDENIGDKDRPECKSPDFINGFPQVDPAVPTSKQFPWGLSAFNPKDYPAEQGINGLVTLPCNKCNFTEWGKNEDNKSVPPRCMEQHTYPLLYTRDEGENWTAAIISFQKTGIGPSKKYFNFFAQRKEGMYTRRTTITLNLAKKGSRTYSVPEFKIGTPTDPNEWSRYADQYRSIRGYLRRPPANFDADDETTVVETEVPENTAPPAATATETKASSTAATLVDDPEDLPF